MKLFVILFFVLFSITGCNNTSATETNDNNTSATNTIELKPQYQVIAQYPHNPSSFTEGLEFTDSIMYESTGLEGKSKLAKVDIKTGKDLQKIDIDKQYFGEGITCINNKIFMATYKTEKGFVFDTKTFKKEKEFTYEGEGWGMTNNGKQIIMSNGSNNLSYRNATTFAEETVISIFDENGPVGNINELEYVDGFVYANVWLTDYIIKIDPKQGKVVAKYDMSNLIKQYLPNLNTDDVLNGIAYNKKVKTFYITGKNWPTLFEIKFN